MRWAAHVACRGEMRNNYKLSVGKPGEKKPLGGRGPAWEDKIKMDLKAIYVKVWPEFIWLEDRDQLRTLVKMLMNLRVT
jgi:hypothetical protein